MTNQEILEKAIQKAIGGGYEGYWKDRYESCLHLSEMEYLISGNNIQDGKTVETLIFDKSFAKALWGEKHVTGVYYSNEVGSTKEYNLSMWQYYLQQMVVAEDPIAYLGENI